MGLVMQEPTLFNYSVKENILYGNDKASNDEIREAATSANAIEFIESQTLFQNYEDSAFVLLEAFKEKKEEIMRQPNMDEAIYEVKLGELKKLTVKEQQEGVF